MRVYFDNAATTSIHPEVIKIMTKCMEEHYGNPSSIHADGRKVRTVIEEARKTIAESLNASIGEIFFTSGGTESNNWAIKCAVRDLGVRRIITSNIEHHCVSHTVDCVEKHQNIEVVQLKADSLGRISYTDLENALKSSDKKTLVSLMHANNEVGTMIDLVKVGELCEANNAYFHSDTVQTIGHFPIDLNTTKIHFISGGAHKFHGPKGVGFIYINGDTVIKPYIDGGAQERNMRAGTENVYGIVGMAKALALSYENLAQWSEDIKAVREYFKGKLVENFADVKFQGDIDGDALYTVLSVSFPKTAKTDLINFSLDIAGISASAGSACSSGAEHDSHVIEALGTCANRKVVRFSFSHLNTKEEVDYCIEKLKSIVPVKEALITV